jgi:tetratricopeptide (TPR) repeat protein
MADGLKLILSNSLEALEQGAFQEFCLSFLPLYNKRYEGLERHGATAAGKTRKGTPDLLKTGAQGKKTAVQCSTEEDYWTPPSASENWKPIKDIMKCIESLKSIEEIVLCSNREIPPSKPNTKSEIITWARPKTSARITLLSLSNFEEEILHKIKYAVVAERHLPEFNAYLEPLSSHIMLKLYREYNAPLETIEEIVKKVGQSIEGEHADFYEQARELASSLKSRFQRSRLPQKGEINRTLGLNDLIPDPLGKLVGIVGIPKIGKTTWVSQYCHLLDRNNIEVLWFETPLHNKFLDDFFTDVARTILGRLCGPTVGNEFAEGKIYLDDLSSILPTLSKPSKKLQVIIDNADRIPQSQLKEIHLMFAMVGKLWEGNEPGIIFVGNRSLKSEGIPLNAEFRSPNWNDNETKQLLTIKGIQIEGDLDKFCEILTPFSGGHPLVALAIARQFPSISDLLFTVASKGPALYDQELTDEVTAILFNDLLPDPDLRNLVLHISPLIYPAKPPLLFHLGQKIMPPLRNPVGLLIEKLKGTVLEGDDSVGYQIPVVFRNVSKQYWNPNTSSDAFKAASEYLLSPKGKVIDLNEISEGITYAIFSGRLADALHWANFILFNAAPKLDKIQLGFFLERIWIIEEALKVPEEDPLKVLYGFTLFQMAIAYKKTGDSQRSIKLANRVLSLSLENLTPPNSAPYLYHSFTSGVHTHLILELSASGQTDEALRQLNKVRIEHFEYFGTGLSGKLDLVELATILIPRGEIAAIPVAFLLSVIQTTQLNDDQVIGKLVSCFCHIGSLAFKKDGRVNDILKSDEGLRIPLWELFVKIAEAEYEMENKHPDTSIDILDQIELDVEAIQVRSNLLMAKLTQMRADALFQYGKTLKAREEYRKSIDLLPKNEPTFDHAWAHFRIGQCSDSEPEASSVFAETARLFEILGYRDLASRAKGEMAVLCYQSKKYKQFVEIIEEVARDYYMNKSLECGPSVAVGLALVLRLNVQLGYTGVLLKGQESDKNLLPKPERGIFIHVMDLAKPNPGMCTAFFIIGLAYELLNESDYAIRCFRDAFGAKPLIEIDFLSRVTAGVYLVDALLLKDNKYDLDSILNELLTSVESIGKISDFIRVTLIFGKGEEDLRKGSISKAFFHKFLDKLEQGTEKFPHSRRHWWLAEIYKRKAGIDSVTQEPDYYPDYLRKSWEYAKESDNFLVLTEVGHHLSFRFCGVAGSIKKLAEMHLSVLLGICHDQGSVERLQIFGDNLVKFWTQVKYRRLTESDLPYLANLRDRAKSFKEKGIPDGLWSPLMILLLLKVTREMKNERYKRALDWAFGKLEDNWEKVPEEEKIYLKNK